MCVCLCTQDIQKYNITILNPHASAMYGSVHVCVCVCVCVCVRKTFKNTTSPS